MSEARYCRREIFTPRFVTVFHLRINAGVFYLPLLNMLVDYLMPLNRLIIKSAWTENVGIYLRKRYVSFGHGLILLCIWKDGRMNLPLPFFQPSSSPPSSFPLPFFPVPSSNPSLASNLPILPLFHSSPLPTSYA